MTQFHEYLFKESLKHGECGSEHQGAFTLGALWAAKHFGKDKPEKLGFRSKREPVKCWCENCDVAVNIMRTRMATCPQCGHTNCARAVSHEVECNRNPRK